MEIFSLSNFYVLVNNHILLYLRSSIDLGSVLVMITRERSFLEYLRIGEDARAAVMELERERVVGDKKREEKRGHIR